MAITRINEFLAAPDKQAELSSFLKSLLPYISGCEGNLACEILQSDETPDCFVVVEKWTSVEAHKQSIDNFPKEQMMAAMPLFGGLPKGRYFNLL